MNERRVTRVAGRMVHSRHYGAGPDVVLIHGLSGSHRWWRYTVPALATRYHVHVPELIGLTAHGPEHPDMPATAALLEQWLDENVESVPHLVGHSMGGQLGIHIAAGPRVLQSLTLVDASGLPRQYSAAEAVRTVVGALPPRAWGSPLFMPTMAIDALRAGPRSLARTALQLLRDDVRPLLTRIRCPTLVVWGARDALVPVRYGRALAAAIPGAQMVVLRKGAHNVMCDRPAEFNRVLLEFLERVD